MFTSTLVQVQDAGIEASACGCKLRLRLVLLSVSVISSIPLFPVPRDHKLNYTNFLH